MIKMPVFSLSCGHEATQESAQVWSDARKRWLALHPWAPYKGELCLDE